MRIQTSLVLLFAFATACSAPQPGVIDQPGLTPGPSCDEQVDNAVIARNVANAIANGTPGPGGNGAMLAFGYGTAHDNAVVDELAYKFMVANSFAYTPPASTTPGGTTIPFPFWQPPGIAISATYQNHLMFVRSYGYADNDPTVGEYAEPDSLFRLASVSKSFTGMGILKLIRDQKTVHGVPFDLTYQPFADADFITHLGGQWQSGSWDTKDCGTPVNTKTFTYPPGCGAMNPELANITVSDLLHHAGGWDRDLPGMGDPNGLSWPPWMMPNTPSIISSTLGVPSPPNCAQLVQYFMNQPLQYEPGTVSSYSNIGYCVLGEIIAYVSGKSYETYIQNNVLQPLDMTETALGYTAQARALDREVTYYDVDPNQPPMQSVFGGKVGVSAPYGGNVYLGTAAASGAWVSSVIDLAHFLGSIASSTLPNYSPNGTTPAWPGELYTLTEEEETYDSLVPCRPGPGCPMGSQPATSWYGAGWDNIWKYGTTPETYYWDKGGGMSGTSSLIEIHGDDNWAVSVVMNGTTPDECGADPTGCTSPYDIYSLAWDVWWYLTNWTTDYFPQYGPASYTAWQTTADFTTAMNTAAGSNQYPSRVDGKTITFVTQPPCTPEELLHDDCPGPITHIQQQYRARLGAPPGSGPQVYKINQSCSDMTTLLQSNSNGPLVSLQKFYDSSLGSWRYQAVFAGP